MYEVGKKLVEDKIITNWKVTDYEKKAGGKIRSVYIGVSTNPSLDSHSCHGTLYT